VTLDHYMRALWQKHGKPGGRRTGYVDNPYTVADLKSALGSVSGDQAFADDFFARYIQGREIVDYRRLLARAGFVVRPQRAGQGSAGQFRVQDVQGRPRAVSAVPPGSPAHTAGLERDDFIVSLGGATMAAAGDVTRAIRQRKPGDTLPIVFERRGQRVSAALRLIEDPEVEVVLAEDAGQTLTDAQKRFRDAWLSSARRNAF